MKALGIEFSADAMHYVLVEHSDNGYSILQQNRLKLAETRSREALVGFQDAVLTVFNSTKPNAIGIKTKPEVGRLRAGAAALKMEGIAVANAPCPVKFISGLRINKCKVTSAGTPKWAEPAFKAACEAIDAEHD